MIASSIQTYQGKFLSSNG